jgi:CheY-like chemotaxis protein
MRILLAEPDLQRLAAMRHVLEHAGHEVMVANDGMVAWDYLTGATQPDLLVTAMHLGVGLPPGTALGLQAQSHHPPVPVIYVPADADLAKLADHEHGAILQNPFEETELVATVNRLWCERRG